MSEPIKLDQQARTTAAGFAYSNDDPANQLDRTPTDYSYVDHALASQRILLEQRLKSETETSELTSTLENLLRAQQRRQPYEFEPSVVISVPDPAYEPEGGSFMAGLVFAMLLVFVIKPFMGLVALAVVALFTAGVLMILMQDRIVDAIIDAQRI